MAKLTPRATAAFDTNAPAELNAQTRAFDPNEARAIFLTIIATNGRMWCPGLWRVFVRLTGLLSSRDPGRQHHNKDRKGDISHEVFYRGCGCAKVSLGLEVKVPSGLNGYWSNVRVCPLLTQSGHRPIKNKEPKLRRMICLRQR